MSCRNLRIRNKAYKRYYYCVKHKKEVNLQQCRECKYREYKEIKQIKGKRHERTKATAIQRYVKEAVWYRDNKRCIFCKRLVPVFNANAHFIPRSAGGKGIEENTFTACDFCHNEQDNGLHTKQYDLEAERYLRSKYPHWDKQKLIYKKHERKEEM